VKNLDTYTFVRGVYTCSGPAYLVHIPFCLCVCMCACVCVCVCVLLFPYLFCLPDKRALTVHWLVDRLFVILRLRFLKRTAVGLGFIFAWRRGFPFVFTGALKPSAIIGGQLLVLLGCLMFIVWKLQLHTSMEQQFWKLV
jgi:hypothetical protein